MKKFCILLLAIILMPTLALGVEIHPNPTGSHPSEYNGTWILDGYESVEDSPWVLEMDPDGGFSMTSESQSLQGKWELLPDPFGNFGDALLMDLDPPGVDDNDFTLHNQAFGLRDSLRGFVFVRPGRKADPYTPDEGKYYSVDEMVGDWQLVAAHAVAGPLEVSFTPEELLAGSGETAIIINFDGGYLNSISSVKELSIRTVPVRFHANTVHFYNPDTGLTHVCYFTSKDTMYMKAYPEPKGATGRLDFARITKAPD